MAKNSMETLELLREAVAVVVQAQQKRVVEQIYTTSLRQQHCWLRLA